MLGLLQVIKSQSQKKEYAKIKVWNICGGTEPCTEGLVLLGVAGTFKG